jgi:hypothetical protein
MRLALALAEAGFAVMPVKLYRDAERWRKRPHIVEWEGAATTDASRIKAWWNCWPIAVPGVPLARCGCVVVDCDRHGGPDGVALFRELGPFPPHPVVQTKSGGEHHWFKQPAVPIGFAKWAGGEVLGLGRFVVGYEVPEGPMPVLPEVFWPKRSEVYPRTVGVDAPVVVANWTAALRVMNPLDWRTQVSDPDRSYAKWFALVGACKAVGIARADFVEWSIGDPAYANDRLAIERIWDSARGEHGGALKGALIARGITVQQAVLQPPHPKVHPTPLMPPLMPKSARSVGARLNGIRDGFLRDPTEPRLFSWSCLLAEVLLSEKLGPLSKYRGFLEGAAMSTPLWTMLGPEGVRRTVDRAFAHVEAQAVKVCDGRT